MYYVEHSYVYIITLSILILACVGQEVAQLMQRDHVMHAALLSLYGIDYFEPNVTNSLPHNYIR